MSANDATFLALINAKIAECEVTLSGINGDINELIAASGLRICSPEYMPSGISLDPMIEVDVKGRPVNPILANMYDWGNRAHESLTRQAAIRGADIQEKRKRMERQRLQEALTELNALPIPFTGGPK